MAIESWKVTRYRSGVASLELTKDDVISLRVRRVATSSIGEFEMIIDNEDDKDLEEGDSLEIELGWEGASLTVTFLGIVEKLEKQGDPPLIDIRCWGRDYGKLMKDQRFIEEYTSENPENIVDDIVAAINDLEEIYEDDETYWSSLTTGSGSYTITPTEETTIKKSRTSSIEMLVGAGSSQKVGIYHYYSTAKDWSVYDTFRFWFYGTNSGETVRVVCASTASDADFTDRYVETFTDNVSGWTEKVLDKSDFTIENGTPSWSSIYNISIEVVPTSTFTWYVDRLIIYEYPAETENKILFLKSKWTGTSPVEHDVSSETLWDAVVRLARREDIQREVYVDETKELNFPVKGHDDPVTKILENDLERYSYDRDSSRKRTREKVIGAKEKTDPTELDDWTEATTDWSTAVGNSPTLVNGYDGTSNKGIQIENTAGGNARGKRTVTEIGGGAIDLTDKYGYKKLKFYFTSANSAGNYVYLLAPDWSNYYWRFLFGDNLDKWVLYSLELGEEYEGYPEWDTTGSPDWSNIQGVGFRADNDTGDTSFTVSIMYFDDGRFVVEDQITGWSADDDVYKEVWDFTIISDNAAQDRIDSDLERWGDTVTLVKNIVIEDGRQTFEQSYKVGIDVPETSTTLDQDISSGVQVIPVTSTDNFAVDEKVYISTEGGGGGNDFGKITSISAGVSITIDTSTSYAHKINDVVCKVYRMEEVEHIISDDGDFTTRLILSEASPDTETTIKDLEIEIEELEREKEKE
jgi:hypothetical protein